MGSIDIIKPLSTVPSDAVNKSLQHQEKMCEKQVWYLGAMQPPTPQILYFHGTKL